MTEPDNWAPSEEVLPETLTALDIAIELKFNNPDIYRVDEGRGMFILMDADEFGHERNTTIEITNSDEGRYIRFVEQFAEVTPRFKQSFLTYGYELNTKEGTIHLITTKDDSDNGLVARARLAQLKRGAISNDSIDDEEVVQTISESQAQRLLTSLKAMKVLIQ